MLDGQDGIAEDVHADSLRFRVAHCERANARLKEENSRLKEKIGSLEGNMDALLQDKTALLDKIAKKELQYGRLLSEKQALERTIDIRTQRHITEQQESLTKGQRQLLQLRMKEAEERIVQSKLETQKAVKHGHSLLLEIERQKREKALLEEEVIHLSKKERQCAQQTHELEKLYSEKLSILQVENRELKRNLESMILDLKLHERKQEIEGLLCYEDSIGTASHPRLKTHSKSYLMATEMKSECPDTFRERECRCFELEEELADYEEMVELMRERTQRLEEELASFKRRCVTLQSIICADSAHPPRK